MNKDTITWMIIASVFLSAIGLYAIVPIVLLLSFVLFVFTKAQSLTAVLFMLLIATILFLILSTAGCSSY